MKFTKRIKLTYKYYKSLGIRKPKKTQKMSDLSIRPDVYAFLTAPQPVLESEKRYE